MPAEWLEPLYQKVLQKCKWIIVIMMLIHTEPYWREMLCLHYLSWGWISISGDTSLLLGNVAPIHCILGRFHLAKPSKGGDQSINWLTWWGGRAGRVKVPCFWGKSALKSWGHYVNGITQFLEAMLIKYSLTLIILKLGLKRELKLSGIMAV